MSQDTTNNPLKTTEEQKQWKILKELATLINYIYGDADKLDMHKKTLNSLLSQSIAYTINTRLPELSKLSKEDKYKMWYQKNRERILKNARERHHTNKMNQKQQIQDTQASATPKDITNPDDTQ